MQAANKGEQEEEVKQAQLQVAQLELDTAQLRAESQRLGAKSLQQALPEMAVSDSGHQARDVEHGSAGHHSPRPKVRSLMSSLVCCFKILSCCRCPLQTDSARCVSRPKC